MSESNATSFGIILKLIIFHLIYALSVHASMLTKIYHTAYFEPNNIANLLARPSSIPTLDACACQCLTDTRCVTGNFFGINQICTLFSSYPSAGQLRWIDNASASVFTFPNRIAILSPNNPPASMGWLFDRNFNTVEDSDYRGYLVNGSSTINESSDYLWMSPGYAGYGSAVNFPFNTNYVVNQTFDLTSTSFSVTAWIWIPSDFSTTNSQFFMIFSHCENRTTDQCLHLVVADGKLKLGFFADDLIGNSLLNTNQWYHVAYVYDRLTSVQRVYLNGKRDGYTTSSGLYAGNSSRFRFGPLSLILYTAYHDGYIDKLVFVSRVKNATELLDEATLVAYYAFDNSFIDSGPNFINSTTQLATAFHPNGRLNQALIINASNTSYFQVSTLYYLGLSNYSYSFSFWISPFVNNGTILQVSSSDNCCVPTIGFNKNGHLTIQTLSINGIYSAVFNSSLLPLNTWTHVAMTYSSGNGIQLFVNGTAIVVSQFHGMIDELKIFSRELNSTEVFQLATLK